MYPFININHMLILTSSSQHVIKLIKKKKTDENMKLIILIVDRICIKIHGLLIRLALCMVIKTVDVVFPYVTGEKTIQFSGRGQRYRSSDTESH